MLSSSIDSHSASGLQHPKRRSPLTISLSSGSGSWESDSGTMKTGKKETAKWLSPKSSALEVQIQTQHKRSQSRRVRIHLLFFSFGILFLGFLRLQLSMTTSMTPSRTVDVDALPMYPVHLQQRGSESLTIPRKRVEKYDRMIKDYPRVFHWILEAGDVSKPIPRLQITDHSKEDRFDMMAQSETEDFSLYWPRERPYYEDCTPIMDWQTTFYPVCNMVHEFFPLQDASYWNNVSTAQQPHLPIFQLLSTAGSWRIVWKYNPPLHLSESIVLKMLHLRHNYTHESFRLHQIDAMAMERLTASPYVVSAFGFCGQTVLTPVSHMSASSFVKTKENQSSRRRLKLARNIARALADVHSIDYPGSTNATLTHNDINMANVVELHGTLQLNDFNIAQLLRWNGTQPCNSSPIRFPSPKWKAPEENHFLAHSNAKGPVPHIDTTKTDVYSLGNIFFTLLTSRQPWVNLEPDGPLNQSQVAARKAAGGIPFVPEKYTNNPKLAQQALYAATMACYRLDPTSRPTATQLAWGLDQAYQWSKQSNTNEIVSKEQVEELFK